MMHTVNVLFIVSRREEPTRSFTSGTAPESDNSKRVAVVLGETFMVLTPTAYTTPHRLHDVA